VANADSHNVVALDAATSQISASIPTAIIPSDLAVDAGDGTLYALIPSENALLVLQEGRLVRQVPVGVEPTDVAVDSSSGLVYVVSYVSRTLWTITPGMWKLRSTELDGSPAAVAVDAGAGRVYAGDAILSSDSSTPTRALALPAGAFPANMPVQIEVDPVGEHVFAVAHNGIPGSNGGMIIYVLDAGSGEVLDVRLGGLSTGTLALDIPRRRLYTTAGRYYQAEHTLYDIDLDTLATLRETKVSGAPSSIAYLPDARRLYLTALSNPSQADSPVDLVAIDAVTLAEVSRRPLGTAPARLAADPVAGLIYVSTGLAGDVQVFASDDARAVH